MTSYFALRALLFAGELLAGSLVLMALAWTFAAQRRASARHLAWTGAFGAAFLLPLMAAILPSPLRILLPGPPETIPVQTLSEAASAAALPADSAIHFDPAFVALAIAAIWLIGVAAVALRFAVGAACLSALRRRSRPFAFAPDDLPRIAATRRECELRISDAENGPITWGLFRPVILLPRTAVFWPRERIHAVLLHELAHIRRRDSLVQALSLIVCAFYWPNPLVWIGARALRREAEMAADDSVLVAGVKPSSYAGELLQLAKEFQSRTPALSALSLFMAAPSSLGARVESVLAPTALRTGVTAMDVVKIGSLAIIAAGALAFACPSLAQDEQSSPSAPPVETTPLPPTAPAAAEVPPASPVPSAPSLPPAPAVAPPPEAPEAQPASEASSAAYHQHAHVSRKCIESAIRQAEREARAAIERARPELERAATNEQTSEEAMRAVRAMQPEIDAAVARATREANAALQRAQPEIDRAIVQAHIDEKAMQAVREAQPQIDAAIREGLVNARNELAREKIDEKIQAHVNQALQRSEQKLDRARMHGDIIIDNQGNDGNSGDHGN